MTWVQLISFTRFRCGNHRLAIETGRWNSTARDDKLCKYWITKCDFLIEDEMHFLYVCPLYNNLRCTISAYTKIQIPGVNVNNTYCKLMQDKRYIVDV